MDAWTGDEVCTPACRDNATDGSTGVTSEQMGHNVYPPIQTRACSSPFIQDADQRCPREILVRSRILLGGLQGSAPVGVEIKRRGVELFGRSVRPWISRLTTNDLHLSIGRVTRLTVR